MAKGGTGRFDMERATAFFAEPETLPSICNHISRGGTLFAWVRAHDLQYRLVYDWLHSDKARLDVYAKSMEGRMAAISDRVVTGLMRIAEADPRAAFAADGSLLPVKDLPEDVALAMSSFEVDTRTNDDGISTSTGRMKLDSRTKGFEMLGRYAGMFRDRVEVTGKNGDPLVVPMTPEQLVQYANERAGGGGE